MTTERIPLTQPIESRKGDFSKDSRSVNCVFENRDQKREFIKRPGLVSFSQVIPIVPPSYTNSQGLYSFANKLYSVISNTLYRTDTLTGVSSTIGSLSSTTNHAYFSKTFLDTVMFFHNTVNAYTYTLATNTFSAITNDKVVSIDINAPGINYSSGITLSFSYSGTGSGVVANASVDSLGHITAVNITNQGSNISVAPTVTVNVPATHTPTGTGTIALFDIVVSSATGIYTGMHVTGSGVAPNARVTNISGTTITVDLAHTSAVSGTITFTDTGSNAQLLCNLNTLPTGPYVPGVVFLDNYMFVGVSSNNRIYNCMLGDPTSWISALNYLSFEQTTDRLVAITKHLNYLIAFGASSTQFFYDNANPTGSPLSLAQAYTNEIGCAHGDSVVTADNTVLWIGTSKTYGKSVYLMDGTTPVRVSTAAIDKHIEADDLLKVASYVYKFSGHTLYILNLHHTMKTLVYDINEKMWYQWTQYSMMSSDQPNPGVWMESYFRPTFYAEVYNVPYVLDDDTATIYYLDVGTYQDATQDIYCRTVTDILDNGTTKRKFYGRLEIVGDKVAGTLQVRHSGDDYNTWSSYRSINLNATRSQINIGGADRRRSWEFLCTSNVPLRLDAAEIDYRVGEMDQEQSIGGGRYRS